MKQTQNITALYVVVVIIPALIQGSGIKMKLDNDNYDDEWEYPEEGDDGNY